MNTIKTNCQNCIFNGEFGCEKNHCQSQKTTKHIVPGGLLGEGQLVICVATYRPTICQDFAAK